MDAVEIAMRTLFRYSPEMMPLDNAFVEYLRENAVAITAAALLFWLVRGALSRTSVFIWRICALVWVIWVLHAAAYESKCVDAPVTDDRWTREWCKAPTISPFILPPPHWVTYALLWLACVAEATRLLAGGCGTSRSTTPILRSIDRTLRSVHDRIGHNARPAASAT